MNPFLFTRRKKLQISCYLGIQEPGKYGYTTQSHTDLWEEPDHVILEVRFMFVCDIKSHTSPNPALSWRIVILTLRCHSSNVLYIHQTKSPLNVSAELFKRSQLTYLLLLKSFLCQ